MVAKRMQWRGFILGGGDVLLIGENLIFVRACLLYEGQLALIGRLGDRVARVSEAVFEWRLRPDHIIVALDDDRVRSPALWHSGPHDHWIVVER